MHNILCHSGWGLFCWVPELADSGGGASRVENLYQTYTCTWPLLRPKPADTKYSHHRLLLHFHTMSFPFDCRLPRKGVCSLTARERHTLPLCGGIALSKWPIMKCGDLEPPLLYRAEDALRDPHHKAMGLRWKGSRHSVPFHWAQPRGWRMCCAPPPGPCAEGASGRVSTRCLAR